MKCYHSGFFILFLFPNKFLFSSFSEEKNSFIALLPVIVNNKVSQNGSTQCSVGMMNESKCHLTTYSKTIGTE